MIDFFEVNQFDYLSNTNPPTFPDGLDIEIVDTLSFLELENLNITELEREHVTLGIYNRPKIFKLGNFSNTTDINSERWTVDYQEDLDFVRKVYLEFINQELQFDLKDVISLLESKPEIRNTVNSEFRNIALKAEGDTK
ncbi:hypothetical protein MCEMRE22_00031 [Candidatus Nanopelagicaceae bacterium]